LDELWFTWAEGDHGTEVVDRIVNCL
jgi:hypothetical protein